jgi:hypothetical protein
MKKQILIGITIGCLLLMTILTIAPNIDSRSMNPNQFDVSGNRLSITNRAKFTNAEIGTIQDYRGSNRIELGDQSLYLLDTNHVKRFSIEATSAKIQNGSGSVALEVDNAGAGTYFNPFTFNSVINPASSAFFGSSINATGSVNVYGSGNGQAVLISSNTIGAINIQPAHNLPTSNTFIFASSNFNIGDTFIAASVSGSVVTFTNGPSSGTGVAGTGLWYVSKGGTQVGSVTVGGTGLFSVANNGSVVGNIIVQ